MKHEVIPAGSLKGKPFRLAKHFTYFSLVLILMATLLLSLFNLYWARSLQYKKSRDFAEVIISNLNYQLFVQFMVPVWSQFSRIRLSDPEQLAQVDKIVRNSLHSFSIKMIKIYDSKGVCAYSFDSKMIGHKEPGSLAYKRASKGETTHRIETEGFLIERLLGITRRVRIVTMAPIMVGLPDSFMGGRILGVIEITQDLSKDIDTMLRFQAKITATIASIMIALFFVLLLIVKKGERIMEERAVEREKLKEELTRAKHLSNLGEMIAAVSHEIRNPLGIIISSAELLAKNNDKKSSKGSIPGIIIEEAGRLNRTITDFLNFARPRSPQLSPVKPKEIINKTIDSFMSLHDAERYHVILNEEEDLPEIMVDYDLIYQAFLNILINSKQAMPEGGKIYLSMVKDGSYITFSFIDDGPGIEEELLDKIWTPFFTTKDKGTGLGLGIVKNNIEAHFGSIRITSHPDKGTCVIVRIPIKGRGQ